LPTQPVDQLLSALTLLTFLFVAGEQARKFKSNQSTATTDRLTADSCTSSSQVKKKAELRASSTLFLILKYSQYFLPVANIAAHAGTARITHGGSPLKKPFNPSSA
jgi:hypothetical protein